MGEEDYSVQAAEVDESFFFELAEGYYYYFYLFIYFFFFFISFY